MTSKRSRSDLKREISTLSNRLARLKKLSRTKRSPNPRTIGGTIQCLRESKGMGLSDLAKKSGISKGALHSIESGLNVNPTIYTLLSVSVGLGIKLSDLVLEWEKNKK